MCSELANIASADRGLWADAPAEFLVGFIVPQTDDADGDQICDIAIHVKPVELNVKNHDVEKDPERTDQVEFQKTADALFKRSLMARDGAEGPEVIPNKVVQQRSLRRQDFAAGQAPSKHMRIAENEEQGHIDCQAGAAHNAKVEKARFM